MTFEIEVQFENEIKLISIEDDDTTMILKRRIAQIFDLNAYDFILSHELEEITSDSSIKIIPKKVFLFKRLGYSNRTLIDSPSHEVITEWFNLASPKMIVSAYNIFIYHHLNEGQEVNLNLFIDIMARFSDRGLNINTLKQETIVDILYKAAKIGDIGAQIIIVLFRKLRDMNNLIHLVGIAASLPFQITLENEELLKEYYLTMFDAGAYTLRNPYTFISDLPHNLLVFFVQYLCDLNVKPSNKDLLAVSQKISFAIFLRHGLNPNHIFHNGDMTILDNEILLCDNTRSGVNQLRQTLTEFKFDLNLSGKSKVKPLMLAAKLNKNEVTNLLLRMGAKW